MLRRRPKPPEPAWSARVAAARATVLRHAETTLRPERLDELERALHGAEADRAALLAAIEELGGDRVTEELKRALRDASRRLGGDAAADPHVASLRRRHETVNDLRNRVEDLARRIDATVADLELLAARSVELSVGRRLRDGDGDVGAELARLHDDLTALELAHEELRHL